MRRRIWHATLMRSGLVTMLALTILLVGLALGWREHRLGQFAQLKRELKQKPVAPEPTNVKPGGKDVLLLQRSQLPGGNGPEFLSATLLPGRGMNVLQITAYLPQKGEVPLLASPSLAEAAHLMDGTGLDEAGGESLALGGAIEVPWAGGISGTAAADNETLITVWHGRHISLPVADKSTMAMGGLLLKMASGSESTTVMPDGGEAQATFHSGNFNGHWISQTEVTTAIQLSSRAIEMTVTARNTGSDPEPVGIGWQPRFAIPSGDRQQAILHLPTGDRTEIEDHRTGQPSGRLLPVAGTEYDFTGRGGVRLGGLSLDDTFVHLRAGLMDSGPVAELRDPASDYGLRLTAISSNIKAFRVFAPAGASFVSIDPQFNYNDPFGREWAKEDDTGMVVLQPGQSVQWKIRLEIFSLTQTAAQPL